MSIRLTLSAFRTTTHRFLPIHPTHNFMDSDTSPPYRASPNLGISTLFNSSPSPECIRVRKRQVTPHPLQAPQPCGTESPGRTTMRSAPHPHVTRKSGDTRPDDSVIVHRRRPEHRHDPARNLDKANGAPQQSPQLVVIVCISTMKY